MFVGYREKRAVADRFVEPDSFASLLLAMIIDNYGIEALDWEPDTITREVYEDYNVILPQINIDKIMNAIVCVTTDKFYNDWLFFNLTAEAFNNDPVDPEILDPATPEQMAWAITEVSFLEDPEDRPEFSREVRNYIGTNLAYQGVTRAVGPLKIARMPKTDPSEIMDEAMLSGFVAGQESDGKFIQDYTIQQTQRLINQFNDTPFLNRDPETWDVFYQKANQTVQSFT